MANKNIDLWNELTKNPLISGLVIFIFITVVIYIIYINVFMNIKIEKDIPNIKIIYR